MSKLKKDGFSAAVDLVNSGFVAEGASLIRALLEPTQSNKTVKSTSGTSPDRTTKITAREEFRRGGRFQLQRFLNAVDAYAAGLSPTTKFTMLMLKKFFNVGDKYALIALTHLRRNAPRQLGLLA